jgi:hypothetical protein
MAWRFIPTAPTHEGSALGPAVAECTACPNIEDGWLKGAEVAAEFATIPVFMPSPDALVQAAQSRAAGHAAADAFIASVTTPPSAPTTPAKRGARMAPKSKPLPHVAHVEGTLKRGSFAYDIGPKTLILGANGRGKTSIVNAITLALLGVAVDVAGKESESQSAALWRHLSHNGAPVTAKVTLVDGRAFWYNKVEGKEADGAHLPKAAHATALPLLTLRDALTGSAPTVRKWALTVADRWVTLDTLRATIASHNAQAALAVGKNEKLSATAWLDVHRDKAEKAKKQAQDAARAAERSLNDLASAAGTPVGDEQIAEAERLASAAAVTTATGVSQAAHDTAVAAQSAAANLLATATGRLADAQGGLTARTAEHAQAATAVNEAQGYVAQLAAMVAAVPAPAMPSDEVRNTLAGLAAFLPAHRAHFNGDCGLCGVTQADAPTYLARIDAMLQGVTAALNPPDPAAEHRGNLAAWQAELARRAAVAGRAHEEATRAALTVQNAQAQLESATRQVEATHHAAALPVLAVDPNAGNAARLAYADLIRRKALHDQIAQARASATGHKAVEATANQILDAIKAVSETLTQSSLGMLEDEVSKYLPDGERFKLELGASFTRAGLVKGGVFRSAMSGAEEARVYAAIACALSGPDVSLVIPAERQWSPSTLRDVMRALADAPCQVILISTIKPEGKIAGKTWTVIDLGDGSDEPEQATPPTTDAEPTAAPTAEPVTHVAPPPVFVPPPSAVISVAPPVAPLGAAWDPQAVPLPPVADLALPPPVVMDGEIPGWMPVQAPPFVGSGNDRPAWWVEDDRRTFSAYYQTTTARYTLYHDGAVARVSAETGKVSIWPPKMPEPPAA